MIIDGLFSGPVQMHLMIIDASRERPVSITEIQAATRLSERQIKAEVERLRLDGEPIGACRGKIHGYYPIRTAEDADAAAAPMVRQISSMARTVRAMLPRHRYLELVGQAVLGGEEQ